MNKTFRKFLVMLLVFTVAMAFSGMSAFAYTALDDDGDRAKAEEGTLGIVTTNSGMLRNVDEGTKAVLSEDYKTVTVTVKTKASKSWGKATKVTLTEKADTTDEEKTANAIPLSGSYTAEEASKTFTYTIPVEEIGKKVPICVYMEDKDPAYWHTYNTQSYYIVLGDKDLYDQLVSAIDNTTDEGLKAKLETARDYVYVNGKNVVPKTADVTMTVSVKGELAKDTSNLPMARRSVTVTDLDRDDVFSFEEALIAAHKAYNSEEGFAAGISEGYFSVSKLWGEDTYNTLFFVNDEGIVSNIQDETVKDGDYLVASVNADDTYYADWYTLFKDPAYAPAAGDSATLTLVGHYGMAYTAEDKVNTPIAGVTVKDIDGNVLGTTNTNGRVTFTVPESASGSITITAEGTTPGTVTDWSTYETKTADCPIIAPAYILTLADKTDPAYAEAVKKAADEAIKAQDEAETAKKQAEANEAAAKAAAEKAAAEQAKAKAEAEAARKTAEEAKAKAEEAKATAEAASEASTTDAEAKAKAEEAAKAAQDALDKANAELAAAQKAQKAAEAKAEKALIAQKKAEANNYTVKGFKVTVKNRKFTVKYSKNKNATGYQIQYKLKTAKKYSVLKKTTKLTFTSKKLKKGKTYQFRVRTYTKVGTTTVYGKWSAVKSVKCK